MSKTKSNKKLSLDKDNNILNLEQSYESNFPSPADFELYEKVHPGMAAEIIKMAKKEQEFRHKTAPMLMNKMTFIIILWMFFSFIVVLAGMYFAYTLIQIWESSKWVVLVLWELLLIWWLFIFSQKENIRKK